MEKSVRMVKWRFPDAFRLGKARLYSTDAPVKPARPMSEGLQQVIENNETKERGKSLKANDSKGKEQESPENTKSVLRYIGKPGRKFLKAKTRNQAPLSSFTPEFKSTIQTKEASGDGFETSPRGAHSSSEPAEVTKSVLRYMKVEPRSDISASDRKAARKSRHASSLNRKAARDAHEAARERNQSYQTLLEDGKVPIRFYTDDRVPVRFHNSLEHKSDIREPKAKSNLETQDPKEAQDPKETQDPKEAKRIRTIAKRERKKANNLQRRRERAQLDTKATKGLRTLSKRLRKQAKKADRRRQRSTIRGFKDGPEIRKVSVLHRPSKSETADKKSEPLRILFCGSDEFSCASLQALAELQKRMPRLISSIDVMIRPGKPSGRSMKTIREVPIKTVAQDLGLQIHERDTFTGWEPPAVNGKPINLIIAVSFGLFVPPRILRGAKYGGLNVHPSLLPNLRGPAPIHHTILTNQPFTGVTLQTLHPEHFDHGLILARTKHFVKVTNDMNYTDLHQKLTPLGAELLTDSLAKNLHVPPCTDIGGFTLSGPGRELQHAPKITPADRRMDFTQDYRFMSQHRALGRLWADLCVDETTTKRVVFERFERFDYYARTSKPNSESEHNTRRPLMSKDTNIQFHNMSEPPPAGFRVLVSRTANGERKPMFYTEYGDAILIALPGKRQRGIARPVILRVTKITVAGDTVRPAATALRGLQKEGRWVVERPRREMFDVGSYRAERLALWGSRVVGFEEGEGGTGRYLQWPFVRKVLDKTQQLSSHGAKGEER